MSQPKAITQVNTGNSVAFPTNYNGRAKFSLGTFITGSPTYTIQQAVMPFVDGALLAPTAADWINHTDPAAVGATTNIQANYDFLPTHIRVIVSAVVAPTDSVRLTIWQEGVAGA